MAFNYNRFLKVSYNYLLHDEFYDDSITLMSGREFERQGGSVEDRRAGDFDTKPSKRLRVQGKLFILYGIDFIRAFCKAKQNQFVLELGKYMKGRGEFSNIEGLDNLGGKVLEIVNSVRKPNLLVIGNHPDFVSIKLQKPLWYFVVPYVMGEIMGEDPYVFANGRYWPEFLARRTHLLRVADGKNKEILKTARASMLEREKQNSYLILPEGATCREDRMIQAQKGGTLWLIETAARNQIPLAVLPVAFVQQTVSRGEIQGEDRYAVHTGKEIYAEELLSGDNRADSKKRRMVVDRIMTDIAEMIPEEKQGFYREFVEKRKSDISPKEIPQVIFES